MSIICCSENCENEAQVWVNEANEPYCVDCGVKKAEFYESVTLPIITLDEYCELSAQELEFFDTDTVILNDDPDGDSGDLMTLEDVGKVINLIKKPGLSIFREPIIMARCVFCEAVAIGYLHQIGGWLARHTHFHTNYSPDDDMAGVQQ